MDTAPEDGTDRWYVVRTKPRAEALADAHLHRRDIKTFFPRLAGLPFRHQTDPQTFEPLFPGYLFARLSLPQQFHLVSWTPGVHGLLSAGSDSPTPVDDGIIDALRSRAAGGEILRQRPFRCGDPVEIGRGPFVGLLGLVERPLSGAGRVRVLLDLLQRQTSVDLDASALLRRSA
jgi:transcription antitermination factor NusG